MSELAIRQDAKNKGTGATRASRDMAKSVSVNKKNKVNKAQQLYYVEIPVLIIIPEGHDLESM